MSACGEATNHLPMAASLYLQHYLFMATYSHMTQWLIQSLLEIPKKFHCIDSSEWTLLLSFPMQSLRRGYVSCDRKKYCFHLFYISASVLECACFCDPLGRIEKTPLFLDLLGRRPRGGEASNWYRRSQTHFMTCWRASSNRLPSACQRVRVIGGRQCPQSPERSV